MNRPLQTLALVGAAVAFAALSACAAIAVDVDLVDGGVVSDASEDVPVIVDPDVDAGDDLDTALDTSDAEPPDADTSADVADAADDTAADAHDTGADADTDAPPVPTANFVAQTSGGLVVVRDDIRVRIGVGAPQPVASVANSRIRLSLGPAGW